MKRSLNSFTVGAPRATCRSWLGSAAAAHGGELVLRELAGLVDSEGTEGAQAGLPPFAGGRCDIGA